ncbi:MAG: hypothetical protein ACI9C3_002380, partial [Yoonia sp.]
MQPSLGVQHTFRKSNWTSLADRGQYLVDRSVKMALAGI